MSRLEPTTSRGSFWDRLQRVDRRALYLILLIVVAIPTLFPVTIPNVPLQTSVDLWDTIQATPEDKIVLLSSQWSQGTRGESRAQASAILTHLMKRKIRFAIVSFVPAASQVILDLTREKAREFGYVYGRDWVHFGFQPSPANYVKAINNDMLTSGGAPRKDAVTNEPLSSLPVMAGITKTTDIHIVVEMSASATHTYWVQFLRQPGPQIGFTPTSVMAPEAIPYYQSGQLAGILWGARGAYDYEQLNNERLGAAYSYGRQYMGPLAFAFMLIILSVAVGNIAMFMSRRNAEEER